MPLGAIGQVPNNSILQGTIRNNLVEGNTTSTWNARSGGTSKTVFKGTQAQITALAQDAKASGWEYNIVGGHIWTLEVTFPWDIIVDQTEAQSNPLYVWELVNTPFERDIMELTDRPFIAALSVQTKDTIDLKLKTNNRTAPAYAPNDSNNLNVMVDATVAHALKRSGVRGKQSIVQSLRRTVIVGNRFDSTNLVDASLNFKVMTKSALLAKYNANANPLNNIPQVLVGAMPETLPLKVYQSPGNYTTTNVSGYSMDQNGINTFVGYLQYPPEYHMISVNKVQITQHWVFNQWSAGTWGLYDAYPNNSGEHNPVDSQAVLGG